MDIELGIQHVTRPVNFSTNAGADEVGTAIAGAIPNGTVRKPSTPWDSERSDRPRFVAWSPIHQGDRATPRNLAHGIVVREILPQTVWLALAMPIGAARHQQMPTPTDIQQAAPLLRRVVPVPHFQTVQTLINKILNLLIAEQHGVAVQAAGMRDDHHTARVAHRPHDLVCGG